MPTYNIPMNMPPSPQAEETGTGDLTREITKAFLSSPSFSRQFMNNANQAIKASTTRPVPRPTPLSDVSDQELFARAIAAEAGAHPADQSHVASVIMNRVASPRFPNTVREVILDPGQISAFNKFTGYNNGGGANSIVNRPAPGGLVDMAVDYMTGLTPTTDATHYYNPDVVTPYWSNDSFTRLPGTAHVFGKAR